MPLRSIATASTATSRTPPINAKVSAKPMIVACSRIVSPTAMIARCHAAAGSGKPCAMKYCCRSARRWRVAGSSSDTFGVMIAEWNCSRFVKKVSTAAVPIAPPRLRIMLKAGCCARLGRRDTDHCNRGDRRHDDRLAKRPDHIGPEQLRRGEILVQPEIDETAGGEDDQANADQQTGIDPLHQQRHERDHQQLRQPCPGHHLTDLLRVEALRHSKVFGEQIGRTVKGKAKQEIGQRAEAEIASAEQAEIDQRLRRDELDDDKRY